MNDSRYDYDRGCGHQLERAVRVGDRVETGTVFLNRADYLDPACAGRGQGHRPGGDLSVISYTVNTPDPII